MQWRKAVSPFNSYEELKHKLTVSCRFWSVKEKKMKLCIR